MKIYPVQNNALSVTKQVGIWNTFDYRVEIIPSNTISKAILILGIIFSDIEKLGNYQFRIFKGLVGQEIELMTDAIIYTVKKESQIRRDGIIVVPANERVSISIIGDMNETSILKFYIQYEYAKDI